MSGFAPSPPENDIVLGYLASLQHRRLTRRQVAICGVARLCCVVQGSLCLGLKVRARNVDGLMVGVRDIPNRKAVPKVRDGVAAITSHGLGSVKTQM